MPYGSTAQTLEEIRGWWWVEECGTSSQKQSRESESGTRRRASKPSVSCARPQYRIPLSGCEHRALDGFPRPMPGTLQSNLTFGYTSRAVGSFHFYHSGKLDETGGRKTRLRQLARELCMKRPARHRSSPMELAPRLNPQAQQHCDAFSKHGLWRCECTESEQ